MGVSHGRAKLGFGLWLGTFIYPAVTVGAEMPAWGKFERSF